MRQIKFRAWDKEQEYMLNSNIVVIAPSNSKFSDYVITGEGIIIREDCKRFEIMQFTGLIDKNGKEVYENDVAKVHKFTQELGESLGIYEGEKEFVAIIEFSIYGGIFLKTGGNDSCPLWECEDGFHEESIEIIGNIYENPELLERSNDTSESN